jgi:hypothetical protein
MRKITGFVALLFIGAVPIAASGQPPTTSLAAVVQAARNDAAQRSGVSANAIELISAEAVTWRDGALGCPVAGMSYTTALVPGYRVRLRAQATDLDYHADARGGLLLCPPGRAVDPVPGLGRS